MDFPVYGVSTLFLLTLLPHLFALPHTPTSYPPPPPSSSSQINSKSVLVALLDSHYTELAELVEKALLLHILEDAVASHNVTIFAPRNDAFERQLDPEFKRFLLEPRNLRSLQTLLMFHIVPKRIGSHEWPSEKSGSVRHRTLGDHHVHLMSKGSGQKVVDLAEIVCPDGVFRLDVVPPTAIATDLASSAGRNRRSGRGRACAAETTSIKMVNKMAGMKRRKEQRIWIFF